MKDKQTAHKSKKHADKQKKVAEKSKAIVKAKPKTARNTPSPTVGQFTRTKRFCLHTWKQHCRKTGQDPLSVRFSREGMQALRVINERMLKKAFQYCAAICRMMGKQTFTVKEANISILLRRGFTSPEQFLENPTDEAQLLCKQIMNNIKYAHNKLESDSHDTEDVIEFKKVFQVLFEDAFDCTTQLDKFLKYTEN